MLFAPLLLIAAQGGLIASGDGLQALNLGAGTAAVRIDCTGAATQALNLGDGTATVNTGSSDASGAALQALQIGAGSAQVAIDSSGAAVQQSQGDSGGAAVAITCSGAVMSSGQATGGIANVWAATGLSPGAVLHFNASALTAQADGSVVTALTDTISGYVAAQGVSGKQPKYGVSGQGGRPYIKFEGGQALTFDGTTGPNLKSIIDSGNFTIILCVSDVQSSTVGSVFGSSAGSTAFNMIANGAYIGRYDGNVVGHTVEWAKPDFICFGATSETAVAGNYGGMGIPFEREYVEVTPFRSSNSVIPATSAALFALGDNNGALTGTGKFKLYDVVVWPFKMTPADYARNVVALRQQNNQPLPFAGISRMDVMDADSLGDAVQANAWQSISYLNANSRGRKYGQWANFSIGSIRIDQLTAKFQEVADYLAYLKLPGSITFFDYINAQNNNQTSATILANYKAYIANGRMLSAWSRFNAIDSTCYGRDVTDRLYANFRGVFNGLFADPTTGMAPVSDVITRVSLDPLIGDGNAFATNGAVYMSGDTVHPNALGYAVIAGLNLPSANAMDTGTSSFATGQAVQTNSGSGTAGVAVNATGGPVQALQTASGTASVLVTAAGSDTQALNVGEGTATVADPGVLVASGTATNSNVGFGTATVQDIVVCSGAALQALNLGAGVALVAVDCVGAATQALQLGDGVAHVSTPGGDLVLTPGFLASRRQKRNWSISK